eukprot:3276284-Lingulodinium_polyedra.AAC.1
MGRFPIWKDGDDTVSSLAAALQPYTKALVDANVDVYGSTDFKAGMNTEQLELFAEPLTELMRLDCRGGYFGQNDMAEAITKIVNAENLADVLLGNVLSKMKGLDDAIMMMAYKIRVMLSHCRVKFDSQGEKP